MGAMLKKTQTNLLGVSGQYGGIRTFLVSVVFPSYARDELAQRNAQKVERGVHLQTALKANKVDLRSLLALPVTDPAHPYKQEYAWEKVCARMDSRVETMYGRWFRSKTLAFYESTEGHKFGMYKDDVINARGWWNRAARTRPTDNTPFFGPYCVMVVDEWEEKWGFFAGQ